MNVTSTYGRLLASWLLTALLATGCTPNAITSPGHTDDENPITGDGDGDGDGAGDGDGDSDGVPDGDSDGNGDGDGDADADADADDEDGTIVDPDPDADITLPMVVDKYYYASGYAGDGASPGLVAESSCPERAGEERGLCHAFTWTPGPAKWATVFWQFPPNNWGAQAGRKVPAGARSISFWAWGENGGEAVSFGAGLDEHDSFKIASPSIVLGTEPKRYTLSLDGVDYGSEVVSGFIWTMNAGTAAQTFYVDDIVWEEGEVDTPGPDWPDGPGANGVSLRVRNLCPFPIWVDGAGAGASLPRVQVANGQIHNYDTPKVWESARVNAYGGAGDGEPLEKAEMTFYIDPNGINHLAYNVTYVDWLGLPLEITSIGGGCNAASHTTGCFSPVASVLDGCPQSFLRSGNRCMSPRSYCLAGHQGDAYCHALDGAISSCSGCPGGTTTNVYACDGPYQQNPRMCAALNRGMTSAPDDPDETKYYQQGPYNDYAKWVHQVCPGIYAFSYDDWLSHGGFRDCAGGSEVRITFCPGG